MRLYIFLFSCYFLIFKKTAFCDTTETDVIKITSVEQFKRNSKNFVTIGGRDYYIQSSDIQASAKAAAQICNTLDMALASFETYEENFRMKNYLRANGKFSPFWSSGLIYGDTKIWSGSGQVMKFADWNSDEYFNYDLCVFLEANNGWSSASCQDFHFFICERKTIFQEIYL